MTNRMKILSAVALFLLGALALAYMNRSNIIIAAIGFAQRMVYRRAQPAGELGRWRNMAGQGEKGHPILLSF